jgi:hypothetical protein
MGIIIVIIGVNYGDMTAVWLEKLHNVIVGRGKFKVNMSCQHLAFSLYQTDATCPVYIFTF